MYSPSNINIKRKREREKERQSEQKSGDNPGLKKKRIKEQKEHIGKQ